MLNLLGPRKPAGIKGSSCGDEKVETGFHCCLASYASPLLQVLCVAPQKSWASDRANWIFSDLFQGCLYT